MSHLSPASQTSSAYVERLSDAEVDREYASYAQQNNISSSTNKLGTPQKRLMLTAFFRRTSPTMIAKLSADQAIALVGQQLCTLEDLRALHRAMLSWSDATTYQFVIGSGFELLASKVHPVYCEQELLLTD